MPQRVVSEPLLCVRRGATNNSITKRKDPLGIGDSIKNDSIPSAL